MNYEFILEAYPEHISFSKFAEIYGVAPVTVKRWYARGVLSEIEKTQDPNGKPMFLKKSVIRFLEEKKGGNK